MSYKSGIGQLSAAPKISPIVIRLGRLGDTILLSTVLSTLHARYGNACRLISSAPWSEEVYSNHPDVKEVWGVRRHAPFLLHPDWWRALWMLMRSRPAPVYVCEPEPRQLSRIKWLLTLSRTDVAHCAFLTDFKELEILHWVDRLHQFAQKTPDAFSCGDSARPSCATPTAPRLFASDSDRVDLNAWLKEQGWDNKPLILVQPGNSRTMRDRGVPPGRIDSKGWPLARWRDLIARVHASEPDALIVLCGAGAERPLLEKIRSAAHVDPVVIATPRLRLLVSLFEVADGMISVDSGPAHVAAAVSLPCLVLFGEYPQHLWLPRARAGAVVMGVGGPPMSTRLESVSVDVVFQAWCELRSRSAMARQPSKGISRATQHSIGL